VEGAGQPRVDRLAQACKVPDGHQICRFHLLFPQPARCAANDRSVRLRELETGRTFSRRSKGGHFH
jgi:hypothetical protein